MRAIEFSSVLCLPSRSLAHRLLKPVLFLAMLAVPRLPLAQIGVTTQHNDIGRTGQNTNETILTPAVVNAAGFGKLFTQTVDGVIFAQPLYLQNVAIPGNGTHNVVFVATENDSVYAFDADSNGGANGPPLWQANLASPAHGAAPGATAVSSNDIAGNIVPVIGITGTPVIDPAAGILYVVSFTSEGTSYVLRLHALNIATGTELAGSPVAIHATIPGTGNGSTNGQLTFNPQWELQRPGLLLVDGVVYVGFGAFSDQGPWHGWLFAYDATTLKQVSVYCATPNGVGGGFWISGAGIAADTDHASADPLGRIYAVTGNGDFDATTPNEASADYGDSVLQLAILKNVLTLTDSFTPSNQASLDAADGDLGSGGVLVIPDADSTAHLLVQSGKEGKIYLINRENLGSYHSPDQVVQEIANGTTSSSWGAGLWGLPAYWNKTVYFPGRNSPLQAFTLTGQSLSTEPTSQTAEVLGYPAPTPSISANGNTNGIVWLLESSHTGASGAVLEAYDASNLQSLLYSSQTNASRDGLNAGVNFALPTVANGKVYAASTFTNYTNKAVYGQLNVFGLLAGVKYAAPPVLSPGTESFTPPLSVSITDATPGAAIYYTTDASIPTAQSTPYTGKITVKSNQIITAIASATGYLQSSPVHAIYTSTTEVPDPVIVSPASGIYANSVPSVTITDTLNSASIYYTIDGTTPNAESNLYTQPFSIAPAVTGPVTLKVIALSAGLTASNVITRQFQINVEGTSIDCGGADGFTTVGCTMQLNKGADLDDVRLQLTNGSLNQATSAFFSTPVEITSFTTDFTFQLTDSVPTGPFAEGFTFTLQNAGPTAVGIGGLGLGYANISLNSVALKFDFYNAAGEGTNSTGIYVAGATPTVPAVNLNGTGINLGSTANDVYDAHLVYNSATSTLAVTITDTTSKVSWSTAFNVDIQTLIEANTAYVGFTGSTNATGTSSQKILSWTYEAGKSATPSTATPAFNKNSGTYSGAQTITITDSTPKAVIYYTTDGSQPGTASAVYAGPITVASSETVTALALAPEDLISAPVANTYTISPLITAVSANYGAYYANITLSGSGFGATRGASTVNFNGTAATASAWSGSSITVSVPYHATTGNLMVTVNGESSNGIPFTVEPSATISGMSPTSGPPGTLVSITGQNLLDAEGLGTVWLSGISLPILSPSNTGIQVRIPPGAATGTIDVHTNGVGNYTPTFTVTSPLQLSSVSANYGAVGARIVLTGATFGATQTSSTVTFNGTKATPSAWSNTSITVTVPNHATTGNLVVTVAGLSSEGIPFTVEPTASITGMSPTSGPAGTLVTITGQNLLDAEGLGTVWLSNISLPILSPSNTGIQVKIPAGAMTGTIDIHTNGVGNYTPTFTVTSGPQIGSVSANYGAAYASVSLSGSGFGATQGSSTVAFNGIVAPIVSWSSTAIALSVPYHATTGNLVVTVAAQPSNGVPFTVEPTASITGMSPTSGPAGTTITITGQNLLDAEGLGTVWMSGISLPILNPSNTSIQVVVPAGAVTGTIDVHTNGVGHYTPTFTVN
jgi:hypothetical protein